jgi:predicted NAD/FAD-binding protein
VRVAVVGGGISGIIASHVLSKAHEVTLFERNSYLGGHTNTQIVSDPKNERLPVDTGFIVCNARNYPNFYKFLDELGVARQDSDMSFGFSCQKTGLQYLGPSVWEFLRAPTNLCRPKFCRMLLEQWRFNRRALRDLQEENLDEMPLREYLQKIGASSFFFDYYLAPLISSIWSAPDSKALEFPVKTFITFFNNHGMLEFRKRPQWQTVVGGSKQYVEEFLKIFQGSVHLNTDIKEIRRDSGRIAITLPGGEVKDFDKVVLATHADESLRLLVDSTTAEGEALGSWSYSANQVVLHCDASVVGPRKRLWAAWNYQKREDLDREKPVAITYYMNKLQRLDAQKDYFVTLNPARGAIAPNKVLYDTNYTHPVYTPASPKSQMILRDLNGVNNTFFCGAYMRYGFHEDGVVSALEVASQFGLSL